MHKKGLILVNIGSPQSYEVADVKKYLTEFLMDEEVINLPFIFRWPLVNLLIVPKRAPYSAANYKKVWMDEGSPIVVYSNRFAKKLQTHLPQFSVKVGLQYSQPSVEQALQELLSEGITDILVAPMFPQYAEATTGSSLKLVQKVAKKLKANVKIKEVKPFFNDQSFIEISADLCRTSLEGKQVDHYVYSFHGLPESHITRIPGCSLNAECCAQISVCAKNCYRAQCFATAKAISAKLGIGNNYSVAFQSRLGRAEWLKPSTDETLTALATQGVKKIAILCPSFVADCIETLEEIGMGGKELYIDKGGQDLYMVPCVNDDGRWAQGFATLITSTYST